MTSVRGRRFRVPRAYLRRESERLFGAPRFRFSTATGIDPLNSSSNEFTDGLKAQSVIRKNPLSLLQLFDHKIHIYVIHIYGLHM